MEGEDRLGFGWWRRVGGWVDSVGKVAQVQVLDSGQRTLGSPLPTGHWE